MEPGVIARTTSAAVCVGAFAAGIAAAVNVPSFRLAGPGWWLGWTTWCLAAVVVILALARHAVHPAASLLFVAAGAALVAEEAAGPGSNVPLAFTTAIAAGGCAAGLGVAATAWTATSGWTRRIVAGAAMIGALAGGPMVALVRDPRARGCYRCELNAVAFGDFPTTADVLARFGAVIAAVAALAGVVGVLVSHRRIDRGEVISLATSTAAAAASFVLLWPRIVGGADATAVGWPRLSAAGCLAVAAAGLWWQPIVARRRLRALARLMTRAAAAPLSGTLEDALGAALGDGRIRLLYPLDDDGLIDSLGLPASDEGPLIQIARNGHVVALVGHTPGRFDDPSDIRTLTATVGLALEHEREAAILAARARGLAGARRQLIETSDRERRALERDLHDTAQQRLVSILIGLRLAMSDVDVHDVDVRQAFSDVQAALDEVRSIGQGIFPSVLADEGLAAALDELAISTPGALEIGCLPIHRVDPVVEATAYLIAEACWRAPVGGTVRVEVDCPDRSLVLRVQGVRATDASFGPLEERAIALGGAWSVDANLLEVVLPCDS